MNQSDVFLKDEGDNWFLRNKEVISGEHSANHKDWISWMLEHYEIRPRRILEIGCSNGWRLNYLQKKYRAECVGVEPSLKAVNDGKKCYPKIKLYRGLSSKLPVKGQFDLVILSFVFHWIARGDLLRSVAEIDQVVGDNGLLIISDFAPNVPEKVFYHHRPTEKIHTYKMNYDEIFASSSVYYLVARFTFDHDSGKMAVEEDSSARGFCSLLRKSLEGFSLKKSSHISQNKTNEQNSFFEE